MTEYKAPNKPATVSGKPTLFLAGSIEMGTADKWQDRVVKALADLDVEIYNPRRDEWDSSWKQEANDPQFREQVEWELAHLTSADHVFFYFDPSTKSPVTMLELGIMLAASDAVSVTIVCPTGFYRKGNIDITAGCASEEVLLSLEDGIAALRKKLTYEF